jgi:hypothetical protein
MKILICLLTLSAVFAGCANRPIPGPGIETLSESQYEDQIEPYTQRTQKYEGIMNVLTFSATLLNTKVMQAQLMQKARLYQWDASTLSSETQKANEDMSKNAQIFVSFYTPERKHDDLHKNKTLWKIFLDVDGHRYEGHATKIKLLTNEVQALYPDHNRFSTPYMLSFPISIKSIDGKSVRLTITGTVASASVDFPP